MAQLFEDGSRTESWGGHSVEMLPLWQVRMAWRLTPGLRLHGSEPRTQNGVKDGEMQRQRETETQRYTERQRQRDRDTETERTEMGKLAGRRVNMVDRGKRDRDLR